MMIVVLNGYFKSLNNITRCVMDQNLYGCDLVPTHTNTNRHHKLLIKQNQQTIPEFVENDDDDDHVEVFFS